MHPRYPISGQDVFVFFVFSLLWRVACPSQAIRNPWGAAKVRTCFWAYSFVLTSVCGKCDYLFEALCFKAIGPFCCGLSESNFHVHVAEWRAQQLRTAPSRSSGHCFACRSTLLSSIIVSKNGHIKPDFTSAEELLSLQRADKRWLQT